VSYSFSVTAPSKGAAIQDAKDQMAAVAKGQPVHARDQCLVDTSIAAAVALLADDADSDVGIAVCGSLGWDVAAESGKEKLTTVTVSITAWLSARPVR